MIDAAGCKSESLGPFSGLHMHRESFRAKHKVSVEMESTRVNLLREIETCMSVGRAVKTYDYIP